jgi:hypothetical protein
MMKVIKSVPVDIWVSGKLLRGTDDPWPYQVGIAEANGPIFGLCSHWWPGEMTHMCYRLDEYFVPEKVLSYRRDRFAQDHDDAWLWFCFDAGTTRPEIKISLDELERAFRELDLLPVPCPNCGGTDHGTECYWEGRQ